MITTLPAVQKSCKSASKIIAMKASVKRFDKKNANKRHRRALNSITREFIDDPDLFDEETFDVPSISSWDIY